jgi:hypothetical protein
MDKRQGYQGKTEVDVITAVMGGFSVVNPEPVPIGEYASTHTGCAALYAEANRMSFRYAGSLTYISHLHLIVDRSQPHVQQAFDLV